jgi:uncharacterized membrane protein YkvA (DUF1232 family)
MNLSAAHGIARLARALPTYVLIRRAARDIAAGRPGPVPRNAAYVERGFWAKLRRLGGRVPFVLDLAAVWYCATDRETPHRVRAIMMGALAYFVVPVDVVPDLIAGFGLVDDATVLATAISAVADHIKPRHVERARATLGFATDAEGTAKPTPI